MEYLLWIVIVAGIIALLLTSGMPYSLNAYAASGFLSMPVIISIVVLIAALIIILIPDVYSDTHEKWAFGTIGLILGHWFKK